MKKIALKLRKIAKELISKKVTKVVKDIEKCNGCHSCH